ncbi:hypothetical protein VOLCADRAFT_119015 [Volvox carteri f. nagariensis]|uniref:Uncharacterized protein n=1 Tax=Volvox carteri f. nagariensis TaxID=3068 RepID=D8U9G5_VOLCA|nr:uncharacterized protein VOLCADRAFT_119015 [Volvox carteri f. nagariensis]EFJ43636.1 hypothetical protein VOLCADRAFT_119015 [Volvox carteri f. nagariensis]|eukprot:XP_002955336.1 hypothetical protein VOLCADRAFT_119015 [Volvox carteri f. nagariensis]
MDPPPSALQSDLLTVKHTQDPTMLFPSHAFGRGGVGHFLCTGHSRVGLHRLPQASQQPASLSVTARRRLGSSRSMGEESSGASASGGSASGAATSLSGFSLISSDPVSVGATRAWETGGVQHTHNFVSSSRTVRPQDVPSASKWAAISYFENDPKEVARHMAIMEHVQAQHEAGKAAERQREQARHNLWAEQQREMFRRQRLEQAARYARSGIRPRSAYADLGAVAAAEDAHGVTEGDAAGAVSPTSSARAASAGGHPSYRDPAERFYTSEAVRSALSASGAAALYGSSGRLRPATAGVASHSGGLYERSLGGASSTQLQLSLSMQRRTYIPLPKKTYVNVHERMAAEALETPAARVAALAAAKARVEEERTQVAMVGELQELESFEARMRSLQRARSRAARPQAQRGNRSSGSGEEGSKEAEEDG